MPDEVTAYITELRRILDKLSEAIEGLDGAQLNWRPAAPDTNSVYVIAAHTMGNLEAWVLGIACGQSIERDRPAEFDSSGESAAPLVARARELAGRFEAALNALPSGALGDMREPQQSHWGIGPASPVSVREALMHTIEHAAIHLGQIELTSDLARAELPG